MLIAPTLEDPIRDTKARAGVDRGRAAHRSTHRDRNHAVPDHAGDPAVPIELLSSGDRALLEIIALVVFAFFDQKYRDALFGELFCNHGAARAGSDDDHFAL